MSDLAIVARWAAVERDPTDAAAKLELTEILQRSGDEATALGLRWAAENERHPDNEDTGDIWCWLPWHGEEDWHRSYRSCLPAVVIAQMGWGKWFYKRGNSMTSRDLPGAFAGLGEALRGLQQVVRLQPITPLESLLDAASRQDDVALYAAADMVLESRSEPEGYVRREELLALLRSLEWSKVTKSCPTCRSSPKYGHKVDCKMVRCLGIITTESRCPRCWGDGRVTDDGPYGDRKTCEECEGTGRERVKS